MIATNNSFPKNFACCRRNLLAVLLMALLWAVPPACLVKLPRTPEGNTLPGLAGADGTEQDPRDSVVWPQEDGTGAYPDWRWWAADAPWDPGGYGDGGTWTLPDGKVVDAAPEEFTWNCPYATEELAGVIHQSSFVETGVALPDTDRFVIYDWFCGMDELNHSPESSFLVQISEPVELRIELKCDAPCYAYLMKNGCQYDSIETCFNTDSDSLAAVSGVLPGLFLLNVEFLFDQLTPEGRGHEFDIHVALNKSLGQPECLLTSATIDSAVESTCSLGEDNGLKSRTVQSELSWQDGDDFNLQCSHLGVEADPFGGMPDAVHSYFADYGGAMPRTVDVILDRELSQEQPDMPLTLAVTTAPCGASSAVVDCDWSSGSEIALHGLTVFPGETLYAVVDGVGSSAFDFPEELPYSLTWTIHEPCE
jgi:hypothetical protein